MRKNENAARDYYQEFLDQEDQDERQEGMTGEEAVEAVRRWEEAQGA